MHTYHWMGEDVCHRPRVSLLEVGGLLSCGEPQRVGQCANFGCSDTVKLSRSSLPVLADVDSDGVKRVDGMRNLDDVGTRSKIVDTEGAVWSVNQSISRQNLYCVLYKMWTAAPVNVKIYTIYYCLCYWFLSANRGCYKNRHNDDEKDGVLTLLVVTHF